MALTVVVGSEATAGEATTVMQANNTAQQGSARYRLLPPLFSERSTTTPTKKKNAKTITTAPTTIPTGIAQPGIARLAFVPPAASTTTAQMRP